MEFTLEYDVVLTPDADNPNQQAAGNVIFDQRTYGFDVTSLSFSGQKYLSDYFTKNTLSSTLSAGYSLEWAVGNKLQITCKSTN